MLPVGSHGFTKVSQTQFYHLFGPIGIAGLLAFYGASFF